MHRKGLVLTRNQSRMYICDMWTRAAAQHQKVSPHTHSSGGETTTSHNSINILTYLFLVTSIIDHLLTCFWEMTMLFTGCGSSNSCSSSIMWSWPLTSTALWSHPSSAECKHPTLSMKQIKRNTTIIQPYNYPQTWATSHASVMQHAEFLIDQSEVT